MVSDVMLFVRTQQRPTTQVIPAESESSFGSLFDGHPYFGDEQSGSVDRSAEFGRVRVEVAEAGVARAAKSAGAPVSVDAAGTMPFSVVPAAGMGVQSVSEECQCVRQDAGDVVASPPAAPFRLSECRSRLPIGSLPPGHGPVPVDSRGRVRRASSFPGGIGDDLGEGEFSEVGDVRKPNG